jgi:hypothetical protein
MSRIPAASGAGVVPVLAMSMVTKGIRENLLQVDSPGDRISHSFLLHITQEGLMTYPTTTGLGIALAIGLGICTPVRAQAQSPNPPGINPAHYQCYKVTGQSHPAVVKLRDQFGASPNVKVLQPVYLCAPVAKGDESIGDEQTHLVCFLDSGIRTPNKTVRVTNQFGAQILKVATPAVLCVPSIKQLQ